MIATQHQRVVEKEAETERKRSVIGNDDFEHVFYPETFKFWLFF